MVGMTLALALVKETSLSVAILEAQATQSPWTAEHYHHRVSALSLASQRILEKLNVWESIKQKRVSPFTWIEVWDAETKSDITFDKKDIFVTHLGHIVENNAIQEALIESVKMHTQIAYLTSMRLASLQKHQDYVALTTESDQCFKAKLIVGADGARSWLRESANIEVEVSDYDQLAIVATVKTEKPHDRCARQVFLKTGPLAHLPLADAHQTSIVWSLPTEEAKRLMALEDEPFCAELTAAFDSRLGSVLEISKRYTFPLRKQQAKQYIKPRIALVGDAAHTIHPLAGQGVNMGFLDAASLAELVIEAFHKHRDFSSIALLKRYERWRKADNLTLHQGVDMIKNLFQSEKPTVHQLRKVGLNLTEAMPWFKKLFIQHAVGNRSGLPKLAM